jgi:hypothetical protein
MLEKAFCDSVIPAITFLVVTGKQSAFLWQLGVIVQFIDGLFDVLKNIPDLDFHFINAMFRASMRNVVTYTASIDQPTIRLANRFGTTAKWSYPFFMRTAVMSPTQVVSTE